MNSENALAGEPVTVTLAGVVYPLAYPMQAVILYKQETAKIDRARAAGRPRLTPEEKLDLRKRRRDILKDWPTKQFADWNDGDVEVTEELLREATALTSALDEDAGVGDSLYEIRNWPKIGSEDFEGLL